MAIRVVRLGSGRAPRGALRIGTVRHPPEKDWAAFARGYRKEMKAPEAKHSLGLLAALSHRIDLSVGCYWQDEDRCHRSVMRSCR
jgi:uncharacterized protein YeaO (DUF488 family)